MSDLLAFFLEMSMTCSLCGGEVIWIGPLVNLTDTKCKKCGEMNCQVVEDATDGDDESDGCCGCGGPLTASGGCDVCMAVE